MAKDSAIQTSPQQEQSAHNTLQKSQADGAQLPSAPYNLNHQEGTSLQHYRPVFGKRRLNQKVRRFKKRALLPSHRSKRSVSDENIEPLNPGKKSQTASESLRQHRDQNTLGDQQSLSPGALTPVKRGSRSDGAPGWLIKPLSIWSQDSNSPECLAIEPILEKLSAESKMGTPVKHGDLWQLFESDFEF